MAKRTICYLLAGVAFAATAAVAPGNVYGQCLLNMFRPNPPVQVTNYAPGCDTCNPCTTCARPVTANYTAAYTPTSYRYGYRRPFNGFFARLFGWDQPYTAGYAPYTARYAPRTVGYAPYTTNYASTGCSTCASPCTTCAAPAAPACGNCGSCATCSGAASTAPSLTTSGFASPVGTGVPASGSCPTCASGVSYGGGSPAMPQFTPGPVGTTPADIAPAISPTEMMPIESGARRSTLKKGADVRDLFTRKSPATLTPLAEPKFVPPATDATASASGAHSGWATHATHRPDFTPEVKSAPAMPAMPAGIRPVVDLDAPAMPRQAPEAKKAPVLFSPFDRTAKAPQRDIIPAVYSQAKAGEIMPASRTTPAPRRAPAAKSRIRTADDDGKVWDDSGWN